MANYSLVVDSNFQPFSFERYIQPYQIYGQEYKAQEDVLSELATKAGIWENLANEQADPDTYKMYKKYSDDLAMQAEQLAREGLNPLSRQNMLNMKRRYSNEIVPIENAYNRRQALIDEQRKLSAADGTMMYDIDASTLRLIDLIRNPQLSYKSLSGDLLRKQVGVAAKNLAQSMRKNERYWRSILDNQYYETIMQSGFKPSEVLSTLRALANKNPAVNNELTKIVEDVVNSSGVKNWGSQDIIKRAYQYAGEGLWEAVGKTDYQMQANRAFGMDIPSPNGRGGGNENDSDFSLNKHPLGTHGKYNKSLKQFEGLRPTEYGFSTTELDKVNLTGIMKEAGRTPDNDFFRRLNEIENMDFDSKEYKAAMLSLAKAYNFEYINEINGALRQRKEIIDRYKKEAEKYSHLGNTPLEQIDMGTRLAKMQQTEGSYAYSIAGKESAMNNILEGLKRSINVYDSEKYEDLEKGLFKVKDDGSREKVGVKEAQDIKDNIKDATITVQKNDKGIYFGLTYKNKEYTFDGEQKIINFNESLNAVNNNLKDFSKSAVEGSPEVTPADLKSFMNGEKTTLPGVTPKYITEDLKMFTFKSGNDYIKIITGLDNKPIAVNTLFSEAYGHGLRAEAVEKMISRGLETLKNSYNQ